MLKLNEVSEIIMGQSPSSATYNTVGEGLPFFQGNADFGDEHPNVRMFCTHPIKIAEVNDVLVSVRAPIGAVNVADKKCCVGRGLAAIRPQKGKSITRYLFHLLLANRGSLENKGTGSTFKAITGKVLNSVKVPHENLVEQKEIADILDKIIATIRKRREQVSLCDDLVKSQFIEMFGEIGSDKNGWGMRPLAECCDVNPKKGEDARIQKGMEVSFVPMQSVSEQGDIDTTVVKTYEEVQKGFTYFSEGDVLFAKITPCMENGKGAIARGLKNSVGFGSTEFHVLRPKAGVCNSEWIYAITSFPQFRQDAARKMTGSAGQRRVPASFLASYMVSCPPFELQEQFTRFVEQTDKSKIPCKMEVAA